MRADVDDPEETERWAPFTLEWPGLAEPEHTPLTLTEREHALDVVLPGIRRANLATPDARIGLIRAGRPADVLAAIGWEGLANRGEEALMPLIAMLRSWEDRFGAQRYGVSPWRRLPRCGAPRCRRSSAASPALPARRQTP